MTQKEAYDQLPQDAKWSSSFGNPGERGFAEIWRTKDNVRYIIKNGTFGDDWTCEIVKERVK